jgi:hypothetical protein
MFGGTVARCPSCGSGVMVFVCPLVEARHNGRKGWAHQIGCKLLCDSCGSVFRVLANGAHLQHAPAATGGVDGPDNKKPQAPHVSPIPILLPPRGVA